MSYRDKFRSIFYVKDTPQRIALSFAFGVFWAFSPLIGIQTIGSFFTAWLLRLNRFIAIAGTYITNPLTTIPAFTVSIWLGAKVMGMEKILPVMNWKTITFMSFIKEMKQLILPFIVGTLLLGTLSAVISYFIVYQLVTRYQKGKGRIEHAP